MEKMYFLKGYILILLNLCISTLCTDDYNLLDSSKKLPTRMLQLMDHYVARSKLKIDEILYIRASYESSPHFEYGYVLSDIFERYRKMVGNIKRPTIFKSDAVFDSIKRTEYVQKHFLEILHLVYMCNEIPPKYAHVAEFDKVRSINVNISMSAIEENRKYRLWVKKKHQKEMKKEREMINKGKIKNRPRVVKRPNKWWPIDYGWEIDYQWW